MKKKRLSNLNLRFTVFDISQAFCEMKYYGFSVLGILLSLYGSTNVSRSIFIGALCVIEYYVLFEICSSI